MTGPGTSEQAPQHLHLSGELSMDVDGASVEVHGEGTQLRIVAADVPSFIARVREAASATGRGTPGRRELGRVAAQLADHGITVRLDSPTRRVAVVGAGVDSATGGLFLGTRRARPASIAALTATDQGRWLLAGAALATGLAAAMLLRRRG